MSTPTAETARKRKSDASDARPKPTTVDRIADTLAAQSAARSGVPTPTPQPSVSERAAQRAALDEKKLYAEYYSQLKNWIALAHIGQNFVATAVSAETAVDLARAGDAPKQ